MKRILPILFVASAVVVVFCQSSEEGAPSEDEAGLANTQAELHSDAAGPSEDPRQSGLESATDSSASAEADSPTLGLPPGSAAIPQRRPAPPNSAEASGEEARRPTATPSREADSRGGGSPPDPGLPPHRDLMVEAGVREAMFQSFPALGECHQMLRELEPDTPSELTFLFDLVVEHDPEAEFGVPALQSVTAGDMAIDNVACFAEVLEELQVPQPDADEPYSTSLQVSLRTDED